MGIVGNKTDQTANADDSVDAVQDEDFAQEFDTPDPAPDLQSSTVDSGKFVKYVGVATTRHITKSDWQAAGVQGQGDAVWHFINNGHLLPASDFSEQALAYLLNKDGRFILVDG